MTAMTAMTVGAAPMTVVTDWTAEKAEAVGRETVRFQHALQDRPMFSDEALIAVLDRYPREKLGVFTMGADPVEWKTWKRGAAPDLTGRELWQAVQAGRIWLNLREVNHFIESYADLAREIFGDIEAHTGTRTFRHDVGLLISSPNAQVFYHLDATPVTLWQIRGEKTMWVYPRQEPFVSDQEIERIVLREQAEQFAYRPEWDASAEVVDMLPGVLVSWPHVVANEPSNGLFASEAPIALNEMLTASDAVEPRATASETSFRMVVTCPSRSAADGT